MKNEQLNNCKTEEMYITCTDGYVWFVFGQTVDEILAERLKLDDGEFVLGPLESLPHHRFSRVIDRKSDVVVVDGEVTASEPEPPKKRQSTTAKVTLQHVDRIEADIANGNGVLVRYRRQTLGVIGVERVGKRVFFRVYETSALIPRIGCTIPKATLDSWREGASVVLNVGRKFADRGLLDSQVVHMAISWGSIYNVSQSFRESVGEWGGADEPTIVATGRTTIARDKLLANIAKLANKLRQEAIAVEIDGVGSLVWGERGKRNYSFDPAYFIR